jgi:hypothetical protein
MGILFLRSSASGGGSPPSDPQNLFVADFSTFNGGLYNFDSIYDDEGTLWELTHEATGGPGGVPCAHIVLNSGNEQYNMGWHTGALGHTFSVGEAMFVRGVTRWDDNWRFTSNNRCKFVEFGLDDVSRVIAYQNYPSPSAGGTLGWRDDGGSGDPYAWAVPGYFGLGGLGIDDDWTGQDAYGSLKIGKQIEIDCCGPGLITYGSKTGTMPTPGANSPAYTSGSAVVYWQFMARSGTISGHEYRVWINNNDYDNPTVIQEAANKTIALPVDNWGDGVSFGSYVDKVIPVTAGMRHMAFAVSLGFAEDHYPG